MSIFGIIGICFFIAFVAFAISSLFILVVFDEDFYYEKTQLKTFIWATISCIVLFIASIFVGIGINTEQEKIFVKKYIAQKETIEASLEVEELSGLERLELVKQATELNGQLAEKKARFELWHFVVYDKTIYNNVELIKFKK